MCSIVLGRACLVDFATSFSTYHARVQDDLQAGTGPLARRAGEHRGLAFPGLVWLFVWTQPEWPPDNIDYTILISTYTAELITSSALVR